MCGAALGGLVEGNHGRLLPMGKQLLLVPGGNKKAICGVFLQHLNEASLQVTIIR